FIRGRFRNASQSDALRGNAIYSLFNQRGSIMTPEASLEMTSIEREAQRLEVALVGVIGNEHEGIAVALALLELLATVIARCAPDPDDSAERFAAALGKKVAKQVAAKVH